MTIRMKLNSMKYRIKSWLKAHTAHIIATISVTALAVIGVYWGSNQLTDFIDKEFIRGSQSSVQVNFTK